MKKLSPEEKMPSEPGEMFTLSLADNSRWVLSAHAQMAPWLSKFASILQLEPGQDEPGSHHLRYMKPDDNAGQSVRDLTLPNISYPHKSMRVWYDHAFPDAICELDNEKEELSEIANMWNSVQPFFQRSIEKGGLPFHAGLAKRDGKGILLAGYGNAGKSTCCRRLPDPWVALCDDEVLVVCDPRDKYMAHPFPTWSDYLWRNSTKTWDVQHSVPIAAIFFIEQADTDAVLSLGAGHAVACIVDSAIQTCRKFWARADKPLQRKFRQEIFSNACKMVAKIPAFRLRVSLNGRFWEEIEAVLS
ncbi:SynChlorMet cassette protein ScmC [Desulfococcaceae bacterium HSG8]|nr:SynChlorMet cassette protein ScmC [Desulfococcaceae bacterium HSG8]